MADSIENTLDSSFWQILASNEDETKRIQSYADTLFRGYSFYPEVDWKRYGFFPPDGHQVLGAWRHPDTIAFAFLVDNPLMQERGRYRQFLIYAVGDQQEISSLDRQILSLKKGLKREAYKEAQMVGAASRLDQMSPNRSIGVFTAVLTFVTALVNAYSYYLRTIEPPKLNSQVLEFTYSALLSLVHFLSLGLLIMVTVICGLFLLKYAFILIKRL